MSPGVYVRMIDTDTIITVPRQYYVLTSATVDGEEWYTIECNDAVADWVCTQSSDQWYRQKLAGYPNVYDIHNELLMLIKIKYG